MVEDKEVFMSRIMLNSKDQHFCNEITITFLFYLFGRNSPVLAFSVNRSFINKEVVFVI